MAIELVTGYAGVGHVSSADVGRFQAGVCGTGRYVLNTGTQFEYTINSSNSISIGSGDAVIQGRHVTIPQNSLETVLLNNGTSGTSRMDVIALRYSKDASTGIERASVVVIQGTTVATGSAVPVPDVTEGDIFDGDFIDEMPLYRVLIDGVNITSVTKVFTTLPRMADMLSLMHPVGSIYISVNSTNPANLFGGRWEEIQGKFLLGRSSEHAAGTSKTGETITLTVKQLPAHTHTGPAHTHSTPNHTHTATSAVSGQHDHTITVASGGGHTHTATSASNGAHTHTVSAVSSVPNLLAANGTGKSVGGFTTAVPITSSSAGSHSHTITVASGGGHTHTATSAKVGSHSHTITVASGGGSTTGSAGTGNTGSTGSGDAINIMPPYLAVYMWKRTS